MPWILAFSSGHRSDDHFICSRWSSEFYPIEEIKIIGVSTSDISLADNVTAWGVTGIGIYAKGTLETIYTGGNLSTTRIQSMTTGDDSDAAMNNQMWSYWGDNTVFDLLA